MRMLTRGAGRPWWGVLIVALSAHPAKVAAEPRYELDWEAEQGCPDERDARRMLAEYLDDGPDTAQFGDEARIEVRIEREDDGRFHAEVAVEGDDERGERSFSGTSCGDVASAAALIAAMLLDPAGVAERVAAKNPQPESAAPATRLALGVHVLGDAGSAPRPTFGGGLVLGLGHGRLHASLRASALLPQRTEVDVPSGAAGELGLYAAGLRAGFELVRGFGDRFGSGPSAGLDAGLVVGRGRGSGLLRAESARQLWIAPALGWALSVSADSFSVGLLAEALAPLHRPAWVLDGYGELYRAPPVVGRLSLEVAWLLPWP